MRVNKTLNGKRVVARALYRSSVQLAYWIGILDECTLPRQFKTPADVFRFIKQLR